MNPRYRLGVLTPSSNTALEPLTSAMLADLPGATAHFARFPVTEISLRDASLRQFDDSKILDAARLLADAKVDVICWSGTSAGWLGFDTDERLCARIGEATGIPATTSVLALNEALSIFGARTLGLVTPYVAEVQQRIVANYEAIGVRCSAERHLGRQVNFSFAEVEPAELQALVREVAAERPEAITTFCTNLRAAQLVHGLEAETGIPVFDTVSTVVWKALRIAGAETIALRRWGRLFEAR